MEGREVETVTETERCAPLIISVVERGKVTWRGCVLDGARMRRFGGPHLCKGSRLIEQLSSEEV